jgi:hypothetical protein
VGGWGEIEIKAKLSPAEAGVWAELGNMQNSGHLRLCQQPRATHALRSDQFKTTKSSQQLFHYLTKLGEFTMVSQPIRLILVEWLYPKDF